MLERARLQVSTKVQPLRQQTSYKLKGCYAWVDYDPFRVVLGHPGHLLFLNHSCTSQGPLIRSECMSEKGTVTWISRGIHARHAPKQCSVREMHGQAHLTLCNLF